MLLLAGLGNPGPKHVWNRHNAGFLFLDAIAQMHQFAPWRRRFHGVIAEGRLDGIRTLALKPGTWMNRSGISVGEAARFYKLPPSQVVVVHDEVDLAPGKIRVKTGGGSAGHNGLRSIDRHFGNAYRRLRIGIGHPGDKNIVPSWVLRDFTADDVAWIEELVPALAEAAPWLARGDDPGFMSRVALLRARAAGASEAPDGV